MKRNLTCSVCKHPIVLKPITFIEGGWQWTVDVPVCINESCLIKRGASRVKHKSLSKPRAY